jgi:hypothetical protein
MSWKQLNQIKRAGYEKDKEIEQFVLNWTEGSIIVV